MSNPNVGADHDRWYLPTLFGIGFVATACVVYRLVGWPIASLANYHLLFQQLDTTLGSRVTVDLEDGAVASAINATAALIGLFVLTSAVSAAAALLYSLRRLRQQRAAALFLAWLLGASIAIKFELWPKMPHALAVFDKADNVLAVAIDRAGPGWLVNYMWFADLLVPLHFWTLMVLISTIGALCASSILGGQRGASRSARILAQDARALLVLCSLTTSLFLAILATSQLSYIYGFRPAQTQASPSELEAARSGCRNRPKANFAPAYSVVPLNFDANLDALCVLELRKAQLSSLLQNMSTAQSLQSSVVFTAPVLIITIFVIGICDKLGGLERVHRKRSLIQSAIFPLYAAIVFKVALLAVALLWNI